VLGIGLVLRLAMVLGLAHFTFCHTRSPHLADPHFTHSLEKLPQYFYVGTLKQHEAKINRQ